MYLKVLVLQMTLILRMFSCEIVVRLCATGVKPGVNPEDVLLCGCDEAEYLKVLVLQMTIILWMSSCAAVIRLCT